MYYKRSAAYAGPGERLVRRHLADRGDAERSQTCRPAHLSERTEIVASAVEEVDVRFVHNANPLHGFPQVGGLGEGLRTVEIFCLKQQDDFIRLLRSPKKVLLGESCFN